MSLERITSIIEQLDNIDLEISKLRSSYIGATCPDNVLKEIISLNKKSLELTEEWLLISRQTRNSQ